MKVSVDIPLDKAGIDKEVRAEITKLRGQVTRLVTQRDSWRKRAEEAEITRAEQWDGLANVRAACENIIKCVNKVTGSEYENCSDSDDGDFSYR